MAYSAIHEEDRCSVRGLCGPNPDTNNRTTLFCAFNEGPVRMSDPQGRSRLAQYCPSYDSGTANGPTLCCDGSQMIEMEPIFRTVQQFFARCPACQINLLNLFCQFLCSVDQSLFINVTETIPAPDDKLGALAIAYYVDEEMVSGMFDSCKDVQFPAANTKVMDLMCGGYTGDDCTPQRWLDFFGTPTNGFTPFKIDFVITPEEKEVGDGIAPLTEYAEKCAYPSNNETESCSCQDCEESCPPLPTAPPPEEICVIGNMDCNTFIVLMVFLGLLLLLVTALVLGNNYLRKNKKSFNVSEEGEALKKERNKVVMPHEVSLS